MKANDIDELLKNAQAPQPPQPDVLERIAQSIAASARPVRPMPPDWMLTAGLLLAGAIVAVAGAARAGFFGVERMTVLERALVFSGLLLFGWFAASEFVHASIPGSRVRLSPGAVLASGCALLLGVFAFCFRDYQTTHFFSAGLVCLGVGLLHAVPAGLLGWLILRRGLAVNPVAAGTLAGAFAGVAGAAMLELHCPNFQVAHVLVWHIAVVPMSGAIGALWAWIRRNR